LLLFPKTDRSSRRLRTAAGQRRRRRPGADRTTVRGARACAFRDPVGNLIRN